jgi:caffeoyl-CoA O-methyltransferase
MDKGFTLESEGLEDYVDNIFHPEDKVLRDIRMRAAQAGLPDIHVGYMDGLHLEVLVRAFGSKKIVEIGTLAGYSGTCLARGLPKDGKLYTFEYAEPHAKVARETFQLAGLAEKVEIFVGAALENLSKIEAHGPFDLVFIDADKESYSAYFEWSVKNLRSGGTILADNTFAGGQIVDSSPNASPRVRALREFNLKAATDPRLRATILPTSDGLTMAVKK